jgi:hypothetical protein
VTGARLPSRLRSLDRPWTRVALVALVAAAALAGFLAVLLPHGSAPPVALLEKPLTVKRALSTTAALFGDQLTAEVDVYSDDRTVDPASVHVRTDFRPYSPISTRIDRTQQGGVSLLRTRIVLECTTRPCLPPQTVGTPVRFAPLTVTYRANGRDARLAVPWEPFQLLSRLPTDASANVGVIDTAPSLQAGFPRSPALLRGALIAVATILGLAGAALVVTALWPSRLLTRRRRPLSPLEQSLLEVESTARSEDEERRRHALDRLATRLAELPSPSLEARTRSLAWGQESPEAQTIASLTDEVRASVNGGGRR